VYSVSDIAPRVVRTIDALFLETLPTELLCVGMSMLLTLLEMWGVRRAIPLITLLHMY
jgi:hypothetical protein